MQPIFHLKPTFYNAIIIHVNQMLSCWVFRIMKHTKRKFNINFSLKYEKSLNSITICVAEKMHYSRMSSHIKRPTIKHKSFAYYSSSSRSRNNGGQSYFSCNACRSKPYSETWTNQHFKYFIIALLQLPYSKG